MVSPQLITVPHAAQQVADVGRAEIVGIMCVAAERVGAIAILKSWKVFWGVAMLRPSLHPSRASKGALAPAVGQIEHL